MTAKPWYRAYIYINVVSGDDCAHDWQDNWPNPGLTTSVCHHKPQSCRFPDTHGESEIRSETVRRSSDTVHSAQYSGY